MNRRSRLTVTGMAMVLMFGAAACGSSTESDGGDSGAGGGGSQEITFLTHWGPDQVGMLEDAAEQFTADNPDVSVTVQAVPFGNLLSTLRTQGSSPDGPTIAGIYDAWLPELVRDGLAAEAPTEVAEEVQAEWPESVVGAASQNGAVHGIPNEVDLYQLNYNKALFEEAGVAEPPSDWDGVIDAAEKITQTADDRQGIGFITNWNSGATHPFLSLLASNGGSFLNEDGTQATLTTPEALETAEFYQELVDAGLTDPTMSTANANTTGPYLDNFVNGKTGMIIMANWWESALRDGMGEDFENVGTAPIPVGPSGSESSSISYSWMTMVNGNAEDGAQAAAWDFLSWLNGPDSGAEGSSAMADILLSMGILPSRNSDVEANSEDLSGEFLASYVDALDNATPFPTVLGGPAAADALQRQIEALLNGQKDAQAAMEDATADVDSALSSAQ